MSRLDDFSGKGITLDLSFITKFHFSTDISMAAIKFS